MQVQFLCECGQAIRTEQSEGPRSVQCPTCGKMLTVAGSAGPLHATNWPVIPPPAGMAVAAMVLGICAFIPGLGVLTGPVAIVLGIVAMAKKRPGRGFAITAVATGAAGFLTVQALLGVYIYVVVTMMSAFGGMPGRVAVSPATMSASPTTLPASANVRATTTDTSAPPATRPAGFERE